MAAAGVECGCSGIRKCLLCEGKVKFDSRSINTLTEEHSKKIQQYKFCVLCGDTFPADKECIHRKDLEKQGCEELEGVIVIDDFVSELEEQSIVTEIDRTIWKPSQSGRQKQVDIRKIRFYLLSYFFCHHSLHGYN